MMILEEVSPEKYHEIVKSYKYFYNSIKGDLRFSDSVLDLYYKKNALMCHLYNDDQLEAFRVKWRA